MFTHALVTRRLIQMSAGTGEVASALKCVLEKAAAAAQRSGKDSKVRFEDTDGRRSVESMTMLNKCEPVA